MGRTSGTDAKVERHVFFFLFTSGTYFVFRQTSLLTKSKKYRRKPKKKKKSFIVNFPRDEKAWRANDLFAFKNLSLKWIWLTWWSRWCERKKTTRRQMPIFSLILDETWLTCPIQTATIRKSVSGKRSKEIKWFLSIKGEQCDADATKWDDQRDAKSQ